jgi:UDP-3-O-acyl-N-acetylglucosamine deacetylase
MHAHFVLRAYRHKVLDGIGAAFALGHDVVQARAAFASGNYAPIFVTVLAASLAGAFVAHRVDNLLIASIS